MLGDLFRTLLYQPLFNLLVFFYNIIPGHDLGIAIIVLTIVLRFILYPLSAKSVKSQKALQDLQPELEKIKKQYQNDKEGMSRATMEFYRKNKINPLSSCLPILIQFPFLIAIYQVLRDGLNNPEVLKLLYSFVHNPGKLDPYFLNFLDLGARNVYLAILAGVTQFWQSRMLMKKKKPAPRASGNDFSAIAANMTNQMVYIMPVLTIFIALSFPAGLSLYWVATTLFSIAQQWLVMRKDSDKDKESFPVS
ncbi:MAG: YidC/Oxa1 family membrane protein insertase [Patescibacteria group bacterium]|nr:YidC/Oxa1 family membrane protein insertase [Patescibacteria group bacterium]